MKQRFMIETGERNVCNFLLSPYTPDPEGARVIDR